MDRLRSIAVAISGEGDNRRGEPFVKPESYYVSSHMRSQQYAQVCLAAEETYNEREANR